MSLNGNYPPKLSGVGLMYATLFLCLLLPTTNRIEGDEDVPPEACPPTEFFNLSVLKKRTLHMKGTSRAISQSFHAIGGIGGAIPLLAAGFLSMSGQQVQMLILQYMPNKFNISFALANTFNIVNYAFNLLMLFVAFNVCREGYWWQPFRTYLCVRFCVEP